jgi:hypothetical protein
MPRKEIDYQNTIIYKIVCNDLNVKDVYVGHTTDFTKRKARHKYDCINHNSKKRNLKVYETIRDNGGWENWSMIEIEKYNCNDCNEACSRERYWYELLNANMNTYCPTLNVEKRMEIQKNLCKEYYEQNKENIKDHKKEYYESNKEAILAHNKRYRDAHKEHINRKCICDICGREHLCRNKSKHIKSQFHLKALNNSNQ